VDLNSRGGVMTKAGRLASIGGGGTNYPPVRGRNVVITRKGVVLA
jgi:hypothetical protein